MMSAATEGERTAAGGTDPAETTSAIGVGTQQGERVPALTAAPLQRAEAEVLAARLRVVAEPTRLMLLSMIHAAPGGEASVGDLAAPIGLTQPTVSYHLRALTEAGLVTRDRRGTWVFYSLVPGALQQVRDLLG